MSYYIFGNIAKMVLFDSKFLKDPFQSHPKKLHIIESLNIIESLFDALSFGYSPFDINRP